MNNPVLKYFEYPNRSIRFIEYKVLQILHFKLVSTTIYEDYPEYDQSYLDWHDHFHDKIR